jgi:hypothetical protein
MYLSDRISFIPCTFWEAWKRYRKWVVFLIEARNAKAMTGVLMRFAMRGKGKYFFLGEEFIFFVLWDDFISIRVCRESKTFFCEREPLPARAVIASFHLLYKLLEYDVLENNIDSIARSLYVFLMGKFLRRVIWDESAHFHLSSLLSLK